jgi:hypothetical protein
LEAHDRVRRNAERVGELPAAVNREVAGGNVQNVPDQPHFEPEEALLLDAGLAS